MWETFIIIRGRFVYFWYVLEEITSFCGCWRNLGDKSHHNYAFRIFIFWNVEPIFILGGQLMPFRQSAEWLLDVLSVLWQWSSVINETGLSFFFTDCLCGYRPRGLCTTLKPYSGQFCCGWCVKALKPKRSFRHNRARPTPFGKRWCCICTDESPSLFLLKEPFNSYLNTLYTFLPSEKSNSLKIKSSCSLEIFDAFFHKLKMFLWCEK